MKRIVICLVVMIGFVGVCGAQNELAKIEYGEAETAFQEQKYKKTLAHLETVKALLGSTNAKVMYLEILSRHQVYLFDKQFNVSKDFAETYGLDPKTYLENTLINLNSLVADYDTYKNIKNIGLESKESYAKKILEVEQRLKDIDANGYKDVTKEITLIEASKRIENLSDTYIASFEASVPLAKLKEVYMINKEHKALNVGMDDFTLGGKLYEAKKYKEARPYYQKACDAGNTMACTALKNLITTIENGG
ncbi:hypothetical protein [Aequorivita sp. Q41]|uniref:hypothetical protein n=1 Tax=Aequorivita sp. Q41 TaxID=3153300 RepID=UPI003241CD27